MTRRTRFSQKHTRPQVQKKATLHGEDSNPGDRGRIGFKDRVEVAVKSGPVKTWADMTPEERASVMASIRPPGVRT